VTLVILGGLVRFTCSRCNQGTFDEPRTHPDTGIFIWHYANSITRPPIKIILLDFTARGTEFHPLGIEYHEPSRTLFVVNHAPSGSCIEVFKYLPAENAATHIKTILHPSIATPNSIQVLSETEILVTNDHYFRRRNNPTLAVLETYLAFRGGSITYVRWSPSAEDGVSEAEVLAHLPFANGIARLNSTTVAVSSSSMGAVYLYSIEQPEAGKSPRLKQIFTIPLSFLPDNLSVDTGGKLLIAGHPHAPSLEEVAKTNRFCQSDEAAEREKCAGARLSWVSEWSEEGGVKALFVGDEYGTSTTAVRDTKGGKGVGVVVGLYERGLYVWRE
jgi:hypothetical protein